MMPMPPSHCSAWRHRLIDGGASSRPVITVAPVVVSADIVSKKASVKLMSWYTMSSGMVAMAAICTHAATTSTKPSRARSSR
jgi:maltose-binding protein MalE